MKKSNESKSLLTNFLCDIGLHSFADREARTHNSGLAKVPDQCSADTFVVNQTLILRINIFGENRRFAKRQTFTAKRSGRYNTDKRQ